MPLSILLVDDIELNRKVASLMLKKLGYRADFAANGIEAIEALEQRSYDIVIMDIQMPVMDGLEAIKIIREKWLNGPKIIVATAFDDYRDTCLDAGADDFLNKPLRIEKLKVAIEYNMPVSTYVSNNLEEFAAMSDPCAMETAPI